jgi:hypothetical protein
MSSAPAAFDRAFYIKLGKGGRWASDAIATSRLRLGWQDIPLAEIHAGEWKRIRAQLAKGHKHKGTVTTDTRRLRDIATSGPADVWITFHGSRLWWGRVADGSVEEDEVSKFRRLVDGWHDTNLKGEPLVTGRIPGVIAQLQSFRGTVCSVEKREVLRRLIAGETSPEWIAVAAARDALVAKLQAAITHLHWKDFETLVDLVFRDAGWRRRSVLGETMKFADLELEEPITGDAYQVQVKSSADLTDFDQYAAGFRSQQRRDFRRLYFVVHSPSPNLADRASGQGRQATEDDGLVELILPPRLSRMVVDAGLVSWVLDKIR